MKEQQKFLIENIINLLRSYEIKMSNSIAINIF